MTHTAKSAAQFLANAEVGQSFTACDGRMLTTFDVLDTEAISETRRRVIVNRTTTRHIASRKVIESSWMGALAMTVTSHPSGWALAYALRFDAVTLATIPVARYSAKRGAEQHTAALASRPKAA